MAIGKKTGGRNFPPGVSGNPKGKPRVPDDIKAFRQLTRFQMERMFNHCAFEDIEVVEKMAKLKTGISPVMRGAAAVAMSVSKGNLWAFNFIIDKLIGGTVAEGPRDVTPPGSSLPPPKKKTFTEFVVAANYPPPFAKQLDMVDFLLTFIEPRLLLGSRGYGKTDYVTIMGIAYDIYMIDWHTWMVITKERKRSSAIISEISNALEANGVQLDKSNSTLIRVKGHEGKDPSVDARSIKTSLRGPHPFGIVMDDPVTEEDVSEATRENVERKYNEALKLTQNILIIGQPAHQHDLYAKLRGLLKKLEVPHGTIPELDHDLEAMRLAGVDDRSISMSYHLKIPTDGSSPFEQIRYLDRFPTGESSVAFIDPSFEGGDYTALTILKAHFEGVAIVGFTWKKAWNHCLDDMVLKLKEYKVAKLAFETNSLGDQPVMMLREAFPALGVVGKKSNTNKHSRIMSAGAYAHLIHLSKESDRVYTDQVVKYEYKAKHDDAPDSLASCLEWVGLIRGKM